MKTAFGPNQWYMKIVSPILCSTLLMDYLNSVSSMYFVKHKCIYVHINWRSAMLITKHHVYVAFTYNQIFCKSEFFPIGVLKFKALTKYFIFQKQIRKQFRPLECPIFVVKGIGWVDCEKRIWIGKHVSHRRWWSHHS